MDRDIMYLGCENGHDWKSVGGANAGCGKNCSCSVPVHECTRCGDSDYGQNDEAETIRDECLEKMLDDDDFRSWCDKLQVDVIEGEFGYEPGEFTVFRADWLPMYREGLTPAQAWQRAMDAHAKARAEEDKAKEENWKRIQAADAAIS
jgi:hypothetical protein